MAFAGPPKSPKKAFSGSGSGLLDSGVGHSSKRLFILAVWGFGTGYLPSGSSSGSERMLQEGSER